MTAIPATLFYCLGLSAKQTAPRSKKPLPLVTPEYSRGLPALRGATLSSSTRLPADFVLSFDSFQDAGNDVPLREVLAMPRQRRRWPCDSGASTQVPRLKCIFGPA